MGTRCGLVQSECPLTVLGLVLITFPTAHEEPLKPSFFVIAQVTFARRESIHSWSCCWFDVQREYIQSNDIIDQYAWHYYSSFHVLQDHNLY